MSDVALSYKMHSYTRLPLTSSTTWCPLGNERSFIVSNVIPQQAACGVGQQVRSVEAAGSQVKSVAGMWHAASQAARAANKEGLVGIGESG